MADTFLYIPTFFLTLTIYKNVQIYVALKGEFYLYKVYKKKFPKKQKKGYIFYIIILPQNNRTYITWDFERIISYQ